MNLIYYLVDKNTKQILRAGDIPGEYGQMTGLQDLPYNSLRDLSWAAAYAHLAFYTYEDAANNGVPTASLDDAKEAAITEKWIELAAERASLIQAQQWRVDRYNSETLLEIAHKEDIKPVLLYMQAIRDLPTTDADPFNIVWPVVPPLPA